MPDKYIKDLSKGTNQYLFSEMDAETQKELDQIFATFGKAPMPMDMWEWKSLKRSQKAIFLDDRNGKGVMAMHTATMQDTREGKAIIPIKVFGGDE